MKNPNIIFSAPYVTEIVDSEIPKCLNDDDVCVRLVTSTISSGTERANLVGDANVHGRYAPAVNFPRRPGYSSAGIVEEVGAGVTKLKPGDRVALSWSAHTKYKVLPVRQVYKLPDNVSFSDGALVHIATFPLAAIRKCHLEIGESAIVMGLGVLGLIGVELLKSAGAVPIIAADPVPEKRELALKLGADFALDPFDAGFSKKVKDITCGGARVALEITGRGEGLDMTLDCMADFGRIALLGCTRCSDFTIDYYRKVHSPGISLIGAHTMARPKQESFPGMWTERDDAQSLIRLMEMGRLSLSSLVDETHSPLDAPAVYERLAKSSSFPTVQFDWNNM